MPSTRQPARRSSRWTTSPPRATRIRTDLGLTGAAADTALGSFLRYERATGQGADAVLAFDDILDAWNLTAADTGAIMDTLIAGHQTYGGSVSESQDLLAKLAPVLQGANMGWQQCTRALVRPAGSR